MASSRFRLVDILGKGGVGVVWRAIQTDLDRPVAVKFLAVEDIGGEDFVKRFQREVDACIRLVHPHIIKVLDAGEQDGKYYYVMELIEGARTLEDVVAREHPLTILRVATMMDQLLDALGYIHDQGMIHRDIKPSNLCVKDGDHLVVMDFGMVKDTRRTVLTQQGNIMGTPRYIAPEVLRGKPLTPQADLFAAGCVLWEMLARRPLFHGASLREVVQSVLKGPIESLTTLRPDLPPTTDAVVGRFLAREPDHRVASAQEGRDVIARWIAPTPTVEQPHPRREPAASRSATGRRPVTKDRPPQVATAGDMPPQDTAGAPRGHAPGRAGDRAAGARDAVAVSPVRARAPIGLGPAFAVAVVLGLVVSAIVLAVMRGRKSTGSSVADGSAREHGVRAATVAPASPGPETPLDVAMRLRKSLQDLGAWTLLTQLRQSPDSRRAAATGQRIVDRYRACGLTEAARAFAPSRDLYFGSLAPALSGKVELYQHLCVLRELEQACEARGIRCPSLALSLFSPRYGMAPGPRLPHPRAVTVTFRTGAFAAALGEKAQGPILDLPGADSDYLLAPSDLRRAPFDPLPADAQTSEFAVLAGRAARETSFELPLPDDVAMAADAELAAGVLELRATNVVRVFLRARDRGDVHLADLRAPSSGELVVWHGLDPRLLCPHSRLRVELIFFAEDRSPVNQQAYVRFVSIRWQPRKDH